MGAIKENNGPLDPKDKHALDGSVHGGERSDDVQTSNLAAQDLFSKGDGHVDFRSLDWMGAAVLITKFQIGLGALSLPGTLHTLGFFPGILCFLILACVTGFAGYCCGNARQYYPQMHSVADAAEVMFGPKGKEAMGFVYYIYLAMVAGAGMLTTSVALNALSDHGACTTIFVLVPCILSLVIGGGFRALDKIAWVSWVGVASILAAIWITIIAVLTQHRPAAAPSVGPIDLDIRVIPDCTFAEGMSAVSNQLFAVGASGAFFSVSAEMKEPRKFTRALIVGQGVIVATCIICASIIYAKVGQHLANPALGSAGPLIKKVAYGIAFPGLIVTAVVYGHIAAKYIFVRLLRGTPHLQSNTARHWTVWSGSMLLTSAFGFIIVGVVPFFGDFLSLVGALVNPVLTNVIPGFMVLFFLARRPVKADELLVIGAVEHGSHETNFILASFAAYRQGWKRAAVHVVALFMLLTGFFIIACGTYATVVSIKTSYDNGDVGGIFSCTDNSLG